MRLPGASIPSRAAPLPEPEVEVETPAFTRSGVVVEAVISDKLASQLRSFRGLWVATRSGRLMGYGTSAAIALSGVPDGVDTVAFRVPSNDGERVSY